jgi:hypothetical protein
VAKYIGLLTADARGKLGGLIMSRARGGTTLKGHAVPTRPGTRAQNSRQGTFGSAIFAWRNMSTSDQTTWSVYAGSLTWTTSLGTTYSPTGLQLWTQAYMNAFFFSTTPPTTLPLGIVPPIPLIGANLSYSGFSLLAGVADAMGSSTSSWIFYSSYMISPSRNYTKTIARRFLGSRVAGTSVNVTGEWGLQYGPLPSPGQIVAVRAVPVIPSVYISGTPFFQNSVVI